MEGGITLVNENKKIINIAMRNRKNCLIIILTLLCLSACICKHETEVEYFLYNEEDNNTQRGHFIDGGNFQYEYKYRTYAPLGIGLLEIIAEQEPVILLYETLENKDPKDSIILKQHFFDVKIVKRKNKINRMHDIDTLIHFWDSIYENVPDRWETKDGTFYYSYTSVSDTLMPLSWKAGSNIYFYLSEKESIIYSYPTLRFRVLETTPKGCKIVLNEASGKTAWVKYKSSEQIIDYDENKKRNWDNRFFLMRDNWMPIERRHKYDFYYIPWEDYLNLCTEFYLDDETKVYGRVRIEGDWMETQQGWIRWKIGNKLLIKDIVEFYVE